MYAVFLSLGHTVLCKTIKSSTIANYLRTAAKNVIQGCRRMPNPNSDLQWQDPWIDMSTGKTDSEKKTFVQAFDNPELCTISALLQIARHWKDLTLTLTLTLPPAM